MNQQSAAHLRSWGTRIGVILAVSGSAVGLGNFLRFPGNAAENGGGAFLIPYFIALILLALIVLVRVLTLGTPDPELPDQSVAAGLNFMWNPDFSALGSFKTWLAAAGQIFFSLSIGFGVIINYASYLKRNDDVVLSGLTASATNEFFEVALGGMITLTAAIVFLGLAATQANVGGTFSTGFSALRIVFVRMPWGDFFGAVWFFMLFLAAITSSLSMLQPTKAFFEEALGLSHKGATMLVTGLCIAGNLFVLWFSQGLVALDTLDFWVGTFMIFIVAGVQIICFSWVFGVDRGLEEAHRGAQIRIPRVFRFIIKYVSPLYLIVIFLGFCIYELPPYVRNLFGESLTGTPAERPAIYAWMVIIATFVMLLVVTAIGARRWRAAGLDVDGRKPPDDTAYAAVEEGRA